jgi:hypothetical protein
MTSATKPQRIMDAVGSFGLLPAQVFMPHEVARSCSLSGRRPPPASFPHAGSVPGGNPPPSPAPGTALSLKQTRRKH